MLDQERIRPNDRVLALISNPYTLYQVLWYHTQYPEGIWDALVFPFSGGDAGQKLLQTMVQECRACGIFTRVLVYTECRADASLWSNLCLFFRYFAQYMTKQRERYDRGSLLRITGRDDYSKVLIRSRASVLETAAVNAYHDRTVVCLEDGLGDYEPPPVAFWRLGSLSSLYNCLLAKLNIMGSDSSGYQLPMPHDGEIIKYNSLPDKLIYRDYKTVKPLSAGPAAGRYPDTLPAGLKPKYDLILFSAPLAKDFGLADPYERLHAWLRENYAGKSVLIKLHPRETYRFDWQDIDADVCRGDVLGEYLLDRYPQAAVLFLFVSTVMLKMLQQRRPFRMIVFSCPKKASAYSKILEQQCALWELPAGDRIQL